MAARAVPSPLASSVEKTNGAKLSRLLIDGGTTVLRNIFDRFHPPASLAAGLNANYPTLTNLLRKRVLIKPHWDKLYPPGGTTPDSNTFDITLLFLLLTNICGLSPPSSGWHTKPPPSDISLEANLARIKFFRNDLIGHISSTSVAAPIFAALWQEISAALVALGLHQSDIDRLKAERWGEGDYIDVLSQWADSEKDIKSQLKDLQTKVQQLAIDKVERTLEEDHQTLQDSKAKLEEVHQIETVVKEGPLSWHDLEVLSNYIQESWKKLGRCLKIREAKLDEIDTTWPELDEKAYKMLLYWKQKDGSTATYRVLNKALSHEFVNRKDLAEHICFHREEELSPSTLHAVGTSQGPPAQGNPGTSDTALRVTLLGVGWSSSTGGLSTINRQLAILLAKHMHVEVTLLVPQFACSEEEKRTARSHNVAIREAEIRPGYDFLDWLSFPPRDLAIDIVMGHGGKLGKQAQIIRESHSCKWVQVVHTAPEEIGRYKNYPGAISKGEEKNRTEVVLCKLANLVVAVGPKLKKAYSSYLRSCNEHKDIFQLTPGIFSEFSVIKQATNESDKFKVLIFGRGDPEDFSLKGYDIAARAIVELRDRSYCLIFVGAPEGKQDEVAENLLQSGISKDQLIVRKFVQSKEGLKELLCEVDLAIMPSRMEAFGLTALEALSAGLPILVSGNSGFGDALRALPLGKPCVVESADPKEWAKAIATVRLKDRAVRLLEIQSLRTCYEEHYSWERQCEALVQKMRSMHVDDCIVAENLLQSGVSNIVHVPPEILARGDLALKAYNKALAEGRTCVKRVPIMLIGQDRAGKTSLKKSLRGKSFNPYEDSTVGIDVDPSHFKVSTEVWKAGEKDQVTDFDTAMSCEHHTARLVVEKLREEKSVPEENVMESVQSRNIPLVDAVSSSVSSDFTSDSSEMPRDPESIQSSSNQEPNHKHVPNADDKSDLTQWPKGNTPLVKPKMPEEVAILIEKRLKEVDKLEGEEDIYSVLWDFGGQLVYYATHPLFLTERAMYLLVHDLSRDPQERATPVAKQGMYEIFEDSFSPKTNLDYLDFWMTSVSSLASPNRNQQVSGVLPEKLPPVFLVCTHADKTYGGGDPSTLAWKVFGSLQTKPYKTHLYDEVFSVDNTKSGLKSECPGVTHLREEILAVAKELPQMKEAIPIKWLNYEKALQVTRDEGHKWITLESAKQIASEVCGVVEDKQFQTLLNFLHDQRILIHFDDTPELSKLVVLDPQWLIDVFKKVITIKPYCFQEKEFKELWLKLDTKGIMEEKLFEHVWSPMFEHEETSESLIAIMEKFSLLCPWPSSDGSCSKQYLVPSMLMSHPPEDIIKLVASAQIPSLFIKFESGHVPPGLFPRLVLQFFQLGKEEFWSPLEPQLYHNFARFYRSGDEDCSVILLCHSSSIEIVVHRGNLSLELADSLQSKMSLSTDSSHISFDVTCARAVCRQVGLMLECMRKEFCWLKNMRYHLSVICPVCCQGCAVSYCRTHRTQDCKQEECLHFWSESELCSGKHVILCTRSAVAQSNVVQVKKCAPWFATLGEQALEDASASRHNQHAFSGKNKKREAESIHQSNVVGATQQPTVFDNLQQMCQDANKKIHKKTTLSSDLKKNARDKGFEVSNNPGQGDCMFYALSEQVELAKGIKLSAAELRNKLVQYLKEHPQLPYGTDLFSFTHGYPTWNAYLETMAKDGTWGDHVILVAAANCYKIGIRVISSLSGRDDIHINPDLPASHSSDALVLGHVHEVHYVSLLPIPALRPTAHPQRFGNTAKRAALCQNTEDQLRDPPDDQLPCFVTPTEWGKIPSHIHRQSKLVYPMATKPRGITLIINNETFGRNSQLTEKEQREEELENRHGSEEDVKALAKLFEALDFTPRIFRNIRRSEILQVLDDASQEDHSAYDCFVLWLMSHGQEGKFYGADGETVPIETVRDFFNSANCPTLKGKPKLIFIQACRGRKKERGDSPNSHTRHPSTPDFEMKAKEPKISKSNPHHADMLIANSTISGYVSFRDEERGTRFVRCIVDVFREFASHEELLCLLTMVNHMICEMGDIDAKQVSEPSSTLTKKLFFWPGM